MTGLSDIPVNVQSGVNAPLADFTGNIPPLLHELRHALQRLIDSGETTTIDLRALPLAPGELEVLEQQLGDGEVHIHLNALGPSDIFETAYPGIWRAIHYNQNEEVMAYFLEVTRVPSLLQTPEQDLQAGISELQQLINREHPS